MYCCIFWENIIKVLLNRIGGRNIFYLKLGYLLLVFYIYWINKLCLLKLESILSDVKIKVFLFKNSLFGIIKVFYLSKFCVFIEDFGVDSW